MFYAIANIVESGVKHHQGNKQTNHTVNLKPPAIKMKQNTLSEHF